MNRDLRLYLLAIALPVILFAVLGGVALIQEASRLRRSDHDSLRIQAEVFASRFRVRARQRAHDLLGGVADDPGASRAAVATALRNLRQSRADVLEARLLGADAPDGFRRFPPPAPPGRDRNGPPPAPSRIPMSASTSSWNLPPARAAWSGSTNRSSPNSPAD